MPQLVEYRCQNCSAVFRSANDRHCLQCGMIDSLEPTSPTDLSDPVSPQCATASSDSTARVGEPINPLVVWRTAKLFLTGIFCLILCVFLVFEPDLRDDPKHISANDILRGLAPGVVGIFVIAITIIHLRRGRTSGE
jgi:hypothetical protein